MSEKLIPGESLRSYFPLLKRQGPSGEPIIYLDNAATTLKPLPVIDAVTKVLSCYTANVHRSVHMLGDEATSIFEGARKKVADFINAQEHEIVLLRNTTEALNLVAKGFKTFGFGVEAMQTGAVGAHPDRAGSVLL